MTHNPKYQAFLGLIQTAQVLLTRASVLLQDPEKEREAAVIAEAAGEIALACQGIRNDFPADSHNVASRSASYASSAIDSAIRRVRPILHDLEYMVDHRAKALREVRDYKEAGIKL